MSNLRIHYISRRSRLTIHIVGKQDGEFVGIGDTGKRYLLWTATKHFFDEIQTDDVQRLALGLVDGYRKSQLYWEL